MHQIQIFSQDVGQRIDSFLSQKFSDFSRNFFQHIFKRSGVLVNGKSVKKSYKLKEGDIVQIDDFQRFLEPAILDEAPKIDLPIKLEKQDYLVLYKPKGVLSHPNSVWDIKQPSVVGFLYHRYKDLPFVGNFIRAGLIHRLDKETDGLMIVVKTEKGLKYFKDLFQQKSKLVEKFISSGAENIEELKKLENQIPLRKFYKAKVEVTDRGKNFLTSISKFPHYIVEKVSPKVPYYQPKIGITKILSVDNNQIDLEILTGRTHQIRYHLANKGLPIKGDCLYGAGDTQDMQLTAYRLIFKDLKEEEVDVRI